MLLISVLLVARQLTFVDALHMHVGNLSTVVDNFGDADIQRNDMHDGDSDALQEEGNSGAMRDSLAKKNRRRRRNPFFPKLPTYKFKWWSLGHDMCMSPESKEEGAKVVSTRCPSALGWNILSLDVVRAKTIKLEGTNLCLRANLNTAPEQFRSGHDKYRGAKIELAHCKTGHSDQLFRFDEDHYLKFDWSFKNDRNTMCIEVEGCHSSTTGKPLQLWEGCNTNNCYWWNAELVNAAPIVAETCSKTQCESCVQCLQNAVSNRAYDATQCGACVNPDSNSGCANALRVCDDPETTCFKDAVCQDARICRWWRLKNCRGVLIESQPSSTFASIGHHGQLQIISSNESSLEPATSMSPTAPQRPGPSAHAPALVERSRRVYLPSSERSDLDYAVAGKCGD